MFARGTDNALWVTVDNNDGWLAGWGTLGGVITAAPAAIAQSITSTSSSGATR